MRKTRLVVIGACAVDTILQVPYFPEQDSKLRATGLTKRRGGNCPNSLEVLQQLIHEEYFHRRESSDPAACPPVPELSLIATLPSRNSHQIPFILSSFDLPTHEQHSMADNEVGRTANERPKLIDFSHCVYREMHTEPVTSYIISDQSTGTRTVINHNALEEMTPEEFRIRADDIFEHSGLDARERNDIEKVWFHFEGRIPPTTLECIKYLRRHAAVTGTAPKPATVDLRISVELEKPRREGLQELAHEADLIIFSRSWAEAEGYTSSAECVKEQAVVLGYTNHSAGHCERTLICTWGDKGACALTLPCAPEALDDRFVSSPAFVLGGKKVLDTVGAGDTFIAGMLFGFLCRGNGGSDISWSLGQKLDFANELAGRKVIQHGFGALGEQVKGLVDVLDQ